MIEERWGSDKVTHRPSGWESLLPHLLPRLETGQAPSLLESLMTPARVKPIITLDVLNQIDVRVGTILSVADVPNSDNLMQLRVDFGDHERTIVAGIRKERVNPREIEGRQALFVVNLEPRKMRGVLSEGMLFDLGYGDGITPVLSVPESPVPNGTRAG